MNKFDYDKFLDVAKELVEEQYGSDEVSKDFNEILDKYEAVLVLMEKEPSNPNSIIDLTNTKYDEIVSQIKTTPNIKVGSFLVKIKKYYGAYDKHKNLAPLDVKILEERNKIWRAVNICLDQRFADAEWKKYFKSLEGGKDIPHDGLVEIIRWLQIVDRMSLFF